MQILMNHTVQDKTNEHCFVPGKSASNALTIYMFVLYSLAYDHKYADLIDL